jgi:dethiobiotin synthetase
MSAARSPGFFLAGTDTGSGKTRVTVGLLRSLRRAGIAASGMKPIASGTIQTLNGIINEDVGAIAAESRTRSGSTPILADINPYCFEHPVSPHIAAQRAGVEIDLQRIAAAYGRLARSTDAVLVEGTGGWLAPIGGRVTMADVAQRLGLPILLVVGLRLGCLNHALLSVEAIQRSGLPLAGWIATAVDPAMQASAENIDALRERLPAPVLAVLPYALDDAADLPLLAAAAQWIFAERSAPG